MYRLWVWLPAQQSTTNSSPEAKPINLRITNTLLHHDDKRLKPNILTPCRSVVAVGPYTFSYIFYLENAIDVLIGHSPIKQLALWHEIIATWFAPRWNFFCFVPLSFLISSVLWDLCSDWLFNMRCKLFKRDFLWSLKIEIKESVDPNTHPSIFSFQQEHNWWRTKLLFLLLWSPENCSLSLSLYFCTQYRELPKASRKRTGNRMNAFCLKWMVEDPRGKSSPEECTSDCNKTLHRGITSCWNPGYLQKPSLLPRDGRRLAWPVLLLQLIELSALLSLSHHHPLSITKVTQEMEYPKGVTYSKARWFVNKNALFQVFEFIAKEGEHDINFYKVSIIFFCNLTCTYYLNLWLF